MVNNTSWKQSQQQTIYDTWNINESIDQHFDVYLWFVQDDPNLPDDSGEVPISIWSGWQFDSHCEIFSLLDR